MREVAGVGLNPRHIPAERLTLALATAAPNGTRPDAARYRALVAERERRRAMMVRVREREDTA